MGGKGWYHPEQEIIWSRKNAAPVNIILKGQLFMDGAKKQKLIVYCKDKKIKEYIADNSSIRDYSFTIMLSLLLVILYLLYLQYTYIVTIVFVILKIC